MAGGARVDEGGVRGPLATVFVSDPTAEAERFAQALRAAGYVVVDVPLSMLVARVAVQHPRVILVDADSEGALDVVGRMRELPDADAIDVLFVARPGGAVASPEEALAHEGSGLFVRPVEVSALVRKVEALTGGAGDATAEPVRSSVPPPPSVPGSSKKRSSVPPSLPPASMRVPSGVPALTVEPKPAIQSTRSLPVRPSKMPSEPPTSGAASSRRVVGLAPPVSPELQQLLSEAEQRQQGGAEPESMIPSPEDEIEAVLPAELLAALDEPLEEDEDEDEVVARSSMSQVAVREPTHDGGGSRTTGASTTGSTPVTGNTPRARRVISDAQLTPPPPQTHGGGTHAGGTGAGVSTTGTSDAQPRADLAQPPRPVPPVASGSLPPPTAWSPPQRLGGGDEDRDDLMANLPPEGAALPAVLGPGDALAAVARAVAGRSTGSLCIATAEAERRAVLREGDLVTVASTAEEESLLAFLGVRGDLPKETVRRLASKFPPFGRHAGAALVARGYLRQDQMWPTLRSHAEWLLARMLQTPAGRLTLEPQPPGRLAGEPSVFGGSTGAEVYVDVVRRIVPPAEAVERLGGPASRLADGPEARLLGECALGAAELEQVNAAPGRAVHDVLDAAPESDIATVVFALAQLGVLEVMRAVGGASAGGVPLEDDGDGAAGVAALDAEAIRERVRARMQLVDDGDYFALLGVTHDATGYEVKRAFLELRRAFDPSRLLTPEIADLAEDVRKITMVLEEAYDILKDAARRERYRRAIEAVPTG